MNISRAIISSVVLLAVGLSSSCDKSDDVARQQAAPAAAGATAAPNTRATTPTSFPAATQPGHILAGDLLAVELGELGGPGVSIVLPKQVAEDGTISIPYVDKPLQASGKTHSEVEQAIVEVYRAENVVKEAEVQVRRLRIAGTGGPAPGPIAPYDLVRCTVGDIEPGIQKVFIQRVGGDGKVSLPYIGNQKLAGLTEQKAEAAIVKWYHDQNIVSRACVSVLRLEAAAPDAGKVDLPDVAIDPVPDALRWLYEQPEHPPGNRDRK